MFGIHKQRTLLMIFAAIGCISVFFPWVNNTDGTTTIGINTGFLSWVAFIAFICVIIVCTYGIKDKPLQGTLQYVAIILCSAVAIIAVIKVLHIVGLGLIILQITSIASIFIALNIAPKKDDGLREITSIENKNL